MVHLLVRNFEWMLFIKKQIVNECLGFDVVGVNLVIAAFDAALVCTLWICYWLTRRGKLVDVVEAHMGRGVFVSACVRFESHIEKK